jgi:hypothetical protein
VGDGESLATTPAPVPFKMKQSRLADFFNDSTKTAAHKEDAHKEEVKSARRLKTSKEKKSKKDQTSQVRAEARWMDTAERQDGHLNQVGKVVSLVMSRTQTQTNIFYFYLMHCLFVWSVSSCYN